MPESPASTTRRWRAIAMLLPRWYRERYGAEVLATHEEQLGRPDGLRFWLRVAGDVALTSLQLWYDGARPDGVPGRRVTPLALVRYGARMAMRGLRRTPGFALAIVLMLALGIGANVAIFSVLDRLLLDPPEYIQHPEQVRRVFVHGPSPFSSGIEYSSELAWPDYRTLREMNGFGSVAAYSASTLTIGSGEASERMTVEMASSSYFPLLGARPVLGRFYDSSDDVIGAAQPVAVLSYGLWQRRFGGSREVLGQTIEVGSGRYAVIGVAPRGFTGIDLASVGVWIPIETAEGIEAGTDQWKTATRWYWISVVARLKAGIPVTRVSAEATMRYRAERETAKKDGPQPDVVLAPALAALGPTPDRETVVAKLLGGVAVMVLLIACANAANLFLARGVRRRKQFAVQSALGVGRARLAAHVLGEAALIALMAGAVALAIAVVLAPALFRFLVPEGTLPTAGVWRAAIVTVLLTFATALLAGLVPAMRSSHVNVLEALRSGHSSMKAAWTRRLLLGFQAALSVILLVGAGMFLRSLQRAQHRELGMDLDVATITLELSREQSANEHLENVMYSALEQLRANPIVQSAAVTSILPFRGFWGLSVDTPRPDSVPRGFPGAMFVAAGSDYFGTLGIPLLRGRVLTDADDRADAAPVAVVNEAMARATWRGRDPIGKCLLVGNPKEHRPCTTVVGVVGDIFFRLTAMEPQMTYYLPPHHPGLANVPAQAILVRTKGDARAMLATLRAAARAAAPGIRYVDVGIVGDGLDRALRSWRLGAMLLSAFGVLALVVAAAGLYSILAFDVAERRFELGLRAALGAGAPRLVRAVAGRVLGVAAAGVVIGFIAAVLLARATADLLFQTSPTDGGVYSAAIGVLLGVAAIAAIVPAWRATGVDPGIAMRAE